MRYGSYWTSTDIHCRQCEKDYEDQEILVVDGVYTWTCSVCAMDRTVELA